MIKARNQSSLTDNLDQDQAIACDGIHRFSPAFHTLPEGFLLLNS
jgi:hypothetical protein